MNDVDANLLQGGWNTPKYHHSDISIKIIKFSLVIILLIISIYIFSYSEMIVLPLLKVPLVVFILFLFLIISTFFYIGRIFQYFFEYLITKSMISYDIETISEEKTTKLLTHFLKLKGFVKIDPPLYDSFLPSYFRFIDSMYRHPDLNLRFIQFKININRKGNEYYRVFLGPIDNSEEDIVNIIVSSDLLFKEE